MFIARHWFIARHGLSTALGPAAALLAACLSLAVSVGAAAEATLIAHPDVGVESMSVNEARLYITMRLRTWPDETPVTVFVLPDDSPVHDRFTRDALRLFPYQLRRVWDKQLFAGTGQVPVTVSTESEMLQRVATTPGALGYIGSLEADGDVRQVRLLP